MLVSTILSLYHAAVSRARLPSGQRPYWTSQPPARRARRRSSQNLCASYSYGASVLDH